MQYFWIPVARFDGCAVSAAGTAFRYVQSADRAAIAIFVADFYADRTNPAPGLAMLLSRCRTDQFAIFHDGLNCAQAGLAAAATIRWPDECHELMPNSAGSSAGDRLKMKTKLILLLANAVAGTPAIDAEERRRQATSAAGR